MTLEKPKRVKFQFKAETDLFELIKCKTFCLSLSLSQNGEYFALFCKDKQLRVFNFTTGKLLLTINESLKVLLLLRLVLY
jgi:peptidylprolyl isomerase domain and WD repeat-containing protein 1